MVQGYFLIALPMAVLTVQVVIVVIFSPMKNSTLPAMPQIGRGKGDGKDTTDNFGRKQPLVLFIILLTG